MIRPLILVSIILAVVPTVNASRIRTVEVNNKAMQQVYLKMGQATVLRFIDKPKKVVIGNQNYFAIEFIENDLTIQPLSDVDTNLFVYTEYRTYGFKLKSCFKCRSDDLVYVRWKSKRTKLKPKKHTKNQIGYKAIDLKVSIPSKLELHVIKTGVIGTRGLRFIDLSLKNTSKRPLNISSLIITATRSKKLLGGQSYILEKEKLKKGGISKGRLFIQSKQNKGFTLNINWEDKNLKLIIPRKYLR